jgi:hypothetical protein
MRTSVRVTSQGSPYGRFRRALDRRQPTAALSAAAELRHVALTDALELLLLLRDSHPDRYPRAALRWHARYCREIPGVTLTEAAAILTLLAALADGPGHPPARALAGLFDARELDQPARILSRWVEAGTNAEKASARR